MLTKAFIFLASISITNIHSLLFDCHDDASYDIEDGPVEELMFTWLGTLQYINIKSGLPNYFRVPRVVLISRQFALSTATDAAHVPDGFALGNVVFGDYERDEEECHITTEELAKGADCDPAILLMPIADVLIHPEFKHFNVKNSVALLKLLTPLRSQYMLPGCLPFKDHMMNGEGKVTNEQLFVLDFSSDVPRDFNEEEREVKAISLLPRELCYLYNEPWMKNLKDSMKSKEICSTGCGFHSGAPIIVHESTGHWTVVAISTGASPCPDPLRKRRPPSPSTHILLHPYVTWITGAIAGKAVGAFDKEDPFGYAMPRSHYKSPYNLLGHGWVGHWWMGGIRCYDRGEAARSLFRFYHEVFQINPTGDTFLTYFLEINAAHGTIIICAKVGMPYRLGQPRVWDLDTTAVKIRIPIVRIKSQYRIQVEAWGYNSSDSSVDESSVGLDHSKDSESL